MPSKELKRSKKQIKSCGLCVENINKIHGMTKTKEYTTWQGIKRRCNNPNDPGYKNYGGRGIKISDNWVNSFENFFADIGKAPGKDYTIERKSVDGDYTKENCCWATKDVQGNNKRNTLFLTVNGVTKTCAQWAEENGVSYNCMYSRIKKGLSPKDCIKRKQE